MDVRRVAALDGLRAMACLAVLTVHARLPGATGGWLGVDVFFALSGWLITRLLLAQRDGTGRIDLITFYLRRAGRLYPGLVLVSIVTLLQGVSGGAAALTSARLSVGLALTYTTDLWLWTVGGRTGALTHAWSLAIEEQFYLAWPVLLMLVRDRRRLVVLTGLLSVASVSVMATLRWRIGQDPAGYFLPHARIWELLAGCLLALLPPKRRAGPVGACCGWAGAGLLIADVALAGRSATATGTTVAAAVAVAGTLLLVQAAEVGSGRVVRALSGKALVWTGRRSYGIYLWHPLVLAPLAHSSRMLAIPLGVAATLAVAALSYRWVERPVQRWVRRVLAAPGLPAIGEPQELGPADSQSAPSLLRA